jgi:nitrate reductase delta subunit
MNAFAILSALLVYPGPDWRSELPGMEAAARELRRSAEREAILGFCGWAASVDPLAIERAYVESFDFSKRSGLYLSFYAYGDRRQRGIAMLALKRRYAAAGLALRDGELPDYLPAVLEFASLSPTEGRAVLAEFRPALELVRSALQAAESPYATLLNAASLTLGELSDADRLATERLASEGVPAELVGLEPFAPPETMPVPLPEPASRQPLCAGGAR